MQARGYAPDCLPRRKLSADRLIKSAELPLRFDTVVELREYLGTKLPKSSVFPNMPPVYPVAPMLRADLADAGIPYRDDAGCVVDFHALRGTCLSWLANEGMPLKVLQDYARHSDPKLTINVYARTLGGLARRRRGPIAGVGTPKPSICASDRHRQRTAR